MNILGRVLLEITLRMRRSQSLQILREIRTAPFASRQEILARQFARLSGLLVLAEEHVPYYREMFQSLRIRSRDIRTLEDFALLPVLTKDIIRNRLGDLVRDDLPKNKLLFGNSGGSTGVPVKFYRDRRVLDAQEAATFRNLLQSGWKPGDMIAFFWGGDDQLYGMSHWEFEIRQHLRRQYQFDPFHSGPDEMDRWLEKWPNLKPSVAFGYASTIARFAEHIQARRGKVDPLLGVFTTAEKLYLPQREVITETFRCSVYDCYGSSEVMNIASECPKGQMHINSDFVVLELDRTEVHAGEPAPFILTALWNEVMPFIRYRNEDCGELLQDTCKCGNNFPLMRLNVARISDNFVLPSGRVVHGEFFTHLMYGSEGISSFQFHQTLQESITLWVVPGPGRATSRQEAIRKAVEQVEQLDPGRVKVQVRETEAIPLSPAGKHRFTRSDVQPQRR
jgi:phenylacetate-CoA ligase